MLRSGSSRLSPSVPRINAPAPDAAPVDKERLAFFDAYTNKLRKLPLDVLVSAKGQRMWFRRSYVASLLGLHGEAYGDFARLMQMHNGRVVFPDHMKADAAIAILRNVAALGCFAFVDQLIPLLTQHAHLDEAHLRDLTEYVDDCKRRVEECGPEINAMTGGLLPVPVLLRYRCDQRCADAAVARINLHLASLTPPGVASPPLEVRRSNVGGLGMFATRDIQVGERILSEFPAFAGSDPYTTCDRCGRGLSSRATVTCPKCNTTRFCSQSCLDAATAHYHAVVCGIPTSSLDQWVAKGKSTTTYNPLIMRKVFAAKLQHLGGGFLHARPADEPPLCDAYRQFDAATPEDDGKLSDDTCTALQTTNMLEGIWRTLPPYAIADPLIDFTAVFQLQYLLVCNGFGGPERLSSFLLQAANFFNHGAAANVAWDRPGADFVFTASRPIGRGEEALISYTQSAAATRQQKAQYGLFE